MGMITVAKEGKAIDWDDVFTRNMERGFHNIDVKKGRTRITSHIYLSMNINSMIVTTHEVESIVEKRLDGA